MSSSITGRPRTGGHQLQRLRRDLSERDLAILRSVHDLHFLSARQLERLHFPPTSHTPLGAVRSCRRVLARLVDCRGLIRLERRIGGVRGGSASFIYSLGPVGQRLLADEAPRRRRHEPGLTFLTHTLAVAELVVQLVEAARADRLVLLDCQTEPACWRRYLGPHGNREVLKPDLRLTIGTAAFEHHWFVEIDLATEHRPAVLRKCRQYAAYYQSGQEQRRAGIFPKVAWLCETTEWAKRLAAAIATDPQLPQELFAVQPMAAGLDLLGGQEIRT